MWPHITARLAAERLAAAPDGDLLTAWLGPLPEARLTAALPMDDAEAGPSCALRYPTGACRSTSSSIRRAPPY